MTHSPRSWLAVCLIVLACWQVARGDAQADFDSLYGDQVRKALASPGKKDAPALADRIFKAAKDLQDAPALRILMLEKAVDLGVLAPAGYETVDAAIETLMTIAPERRADWQAKRLQVLQARFQTARPDEKQAAGDEYLAALIAAADEEVDAGQIDKAIAHYKQAFDAGNTFRSSAKTDIAERIHLAEARREIDRQQKQWQDKLAANPADSATREKLVKLIVLELDAPAKAEPFLNDDLDQGTRTYVPLAAKEVDSLEEKVALEMGRWYESLLTGASTTGARTALEHARAYYRRYLEIHTAKDADSLKAAMSLKRVEDEAKKRNIVWAKEKLVFSDPKVADAVHRASKYLLALQRPDGTWPECPTWENGVQVKSQSVGTTSLAVLALLETGADPKSPGITKALRWLADQPTPKTYSLAYRIAAFAALDASVRGRYFGRLRDDARLLLLAGGMGNYTYDCTVKPARWWDNSNSQHGVLGMASADQAGLTTPKSYWMAVMKHWQTCQNDDGGWSYTGGGSGNRVGWHPPSIDTMTAAGLASLYAAINATSATPDAAKRAAASCIPIRKGLAWMDRHFPRPKNTNTNNNNQNPCYYLYVISRVGLASEKQTFGNANWAEWGTQFLLEALQKPSTEKSCPTCHLKFASSLKQCWRCKVDLVGPPALPADCSCWYDTSWDTSMALLFLVNAERAKNR